MRSSNLTYTQCIWLTVISGALVIFTIYGLSGNGTTNILNSNEFKIDPEISSLKSLIAVLKSEVINDHSKIEKLESEVQELKLDHKNVVPNKNDNSLYVSIEDDENVDEKSEAIRSSRNKAAIVFKKIDESKKQKQQKESRKTGTESASCPARKLFYSNEGDIQMLHAYEIIPFDNKNGGVWYQGFEITYDKEKIKQEEPLQVFVVPHSHNDPGWWYTFEGYYGMYSNAILSNIIKYLNDWNDIKFIYSEMSFLELWWKKHSFEDRKKMKELIQNGKLEIPTGAWVMTDEANSHLYSIVTEMFEGHEFLMNTIGIRPKSHWSIDPFGLSPTMSYLLRQANITNLAINRVHYAVKKFLAETKDLEFYWRQLWAGKSDKTDVFTHMFPFGGYDIPSTCGPDRRICCQYDFRRIGTGGCSHFGTESVAITDSNLEERATTLADQYRKKGQLFKTNIVLVPLGEDFRWNWDSEWQAHHSNYIKLFNYMNNKTEWNIKVKFGTLDDYFTAVHKSIKKEDIKTLSGDFFTYADHDDHYWSGYYTSRPFYKHMDRTVQHYVRAADIAYASWQWKSKTSGILAENFEGNLFYDLLVTARRHLSVFQHHDGVTGTAKNDVVIDYAKKMLEAIQNCQKVIAAAANALSENPIKSQIPVYKNDEIYTFDKLPTKHVFDKIGKTITLFNSLPYDRQELICIIVPETIYGIASENNADEIEQEIYPFFSLQNADFNFSAANNFELCFIAKIPAFAFKTLKLVKKENQKMAKVSANFNVNLGSFKVEAQSQSTDGNSNNQIELSNDQIKISVDSSKGYIRSMNLKNEENFETKIDLHFIKYGARGRQPNWTSPEPNSVSGSYLFLPDGPATELNISSTKLLIVKGFLKQQIFAKHSTIIPLLQTITLKKDDNFVEIQNLVDIRSTADFELGMRLKTNVKGDNFFTDLNAYQMIRRRRFKGKLPIQGHFYPMPSSAFIEDETQRITLLGRQANGVASLEPGWLEVMLDRRLTNDDDRGLNQGLNDNLLTQSTFLLSIEKFIKSPASNGYDATTIGYHSLPSQHASLRLHSPIIIMESSESAKTSFSLLKSSFPCDIYALSFRPLSAPTIYGEPDQFRVSSTDSAAIILQRFGTECGLKSTMPPGISCSISDSSDSISLTEYFTLNPTEIQSISLTMLYENEKTTKIELEPMEIKSLKIKF